VLTNDDRDPNLVDDMSYVHGILSHC